MRGGESRLFFCEVNMMNLVDVAQDRNLVRALIQEGPLDFYWGGDSSTTFKKAKSYTSQELKDMGHSGNTFRARSAGLYKMVEIPGGYYNFITNEVNKSVGIQQFDNVEAYQRALLGYTYGLNIKSSQRRSEMSTKNRLYFFQRVITELVSIEENFINDIKIEHPEINLIPDASKIKRQISQNKNFKVDALQNEFNNYLKTFDNFFATFFKRGANKNAEIFEDSYEGFLSILQKISMQGNISSLYTTERLGRFLKSYLNNEEIDKIKYKMVNQYFRGVFNLKMTAENNGYVKVKELEKNMKEEKIKNINLYSLSKQGNDLEIFKQVIVGPFLSSLGNSWHTIKNEQNGWSGNINLTDGEIDIIVKQKYWDRFYSDLKKTNFNMMELTFQAAEDSRSNRWAFGKFKGDIGEMITAVLSHHYFGAAKYAGNKKFESGKKSTADTIITVNSHEYGIQVKEYKKMGEDFYDRVDKLYKKRDKSFFLSANEEVTKYFSVNDIYVLASLVELFHEDKFTTDIINKVLLKMNLGAIRAVQFEKILFEEDDFTSIDYNLRIPLYRVRGVYYPASYVLYDTYKFVMEAYEKGQDIKLEKNTFKLKQISMSSRDNIVKMRSGRANSKDEEEKNNAVVLAMKDQYRKARDLISLMEVYQV